MLRAMIDELVAQRAGSLRVRMFQDEVYASQAAKSPIYGFADGDFIPRDESGAALTRGNDAFWIITFGLYGGVSLLSVFAALSLPLLFVALTGDGNIARSGPALALASIVGLFAIDCLVNGMINPIYLLTAGAVMSVTAFSRSRANCATNVGRRSDRHRSFSECRDAGRYKPASAKVENPRLSSRP